MNYYTEIEHYIKKNEVNKKARFLEENQDTLNNYWNIGRLIVEAQGGSKRAKYGNGLIKEWSIKYTEKYGITYSTRNLMLFRQYFNTFPNVNTLCSHLNWSQIRLFLSIKDENKRNYYINLCISKKLSVRELKKEIKNNSYERLIDKPNKMELIVPPKKYNILENMKNPIFLELDKNEVINNEHDLEIIILAKLKSFFNQLGEGFALIENQYTITINSQNYYIDILLFNVNLNCYVVVELKFRELKKEDKAQIEFYMQAIDNQLKKDFHNKSMGIIISKKQNEFIASFVKSDTVIQLTYEVKK